MIFAWFWLVVVGWIAASSHAQPRVREQPHADSVRVPILVYHSIAAHRAGQNGE
jgi:hypothetical protein